MANRHLSRSIVLQTLFELDFASGGAEGRWEEGKLRDSLTRNLREFAPGLEENSFVFSLSELVITKRLAIDQIIEKTAPDWPIGRISAVDRNILRIGLAELLFGDRKEVPPKVAINEAIELAKTFGGENSGKFVNGVLGAVYKELGEPGKAQTSRSKEKEEAADLSKLPVEKLGGALVYSRREGEILFALVHDVFGYWTLSKGLLADGEDPASGAVRKIKEELGLDASVLDGLGENQYVAVNPERGKILKKVSYFLAESPYRELTLGKSGGLDEARWFRLAELPDLRIYGDIVPFIMKAIEIINKK